MRCIPSGLNCLSSTVGVCAIKLLDSFHSILPQLVSDKCEALGAPGSIVTQVKLRDGANSLEKLLIKG